MSERLGRCGLGESHASLNGFLKNPPGTTSQLSNASNGLGEEGKPFQDKRLEPIAVVGFSLKFPQEAATSEGFWRLMTERRCAMTDWPKERLNVDAFYHPDNGRPDTVIPLFYDHYTSVLIGFTLRYHSKGVTSLKNPLGTSMHRSSLLHRPKRPRWILSIAFFWKLPKGLLRMVDNHTLLMYEHLLIPNSGDSDG